MYLNIINNIRHEGNRKNKKTDSSLEQEKNNLENEVSTNKNRNKTVNNQGCMKHCSCMFCIFIKERIL